MGHGIGCGDSLASCPRGESPLPRSRGGTDLDEHLRGSPCPQSRAGIDIDEHLQVANPPGTRRRPPSPDAEHSFSMQETFKEDSALQTSVEPSIAEMEEKGVSADAEEHELANGIPEVTMEDHDNGNGSGHNHKPKRLLI